MVELYEAILFHNKIILKTKIKDFFIHTQKKSLSNSGRFSFHYKFKFGTLYLTFGALRKTSYNLILLS